MKAKVLKQKHLTGVTGCVCEEQFTNMLKDNEDITWLSNQIKPMVHLTLPPRWALKLQTFVSVNTQRCKKETICLLFLQVFSWETWQNLSWEAELLLIQELIKGSPLFISCTQSRQKIFFVLIYKKDECISNDVIK